MPNTQDELVVDFLLEARQDIAHLSSLRLELEAAPDDDKVDVALRLLHTLKGNAGLFGLEGLARAAHRGEELLSLPLQPEALSGLDAEIAAIERQLAELATSCGVDHASPFVPPGPARQAQVKVEVELIDKLHDLAGELAMLARQLRPGAAGDPGESLGDPLRRVTEALQAAVQELRAQTLRSALAPYQPFVAALAAALGKQVALELAGCDVPLERRLLATLENPLLHLVRNAVIHGIELPEERLGLGKPGQGRVWIEARLAGGDAVIEVGDDGAGLDSRRLVQAGGAPQAGGEVHLQEVIFEPGVSSAAEATPLSGRGLGLGAVRRAVQDLGGTVRCHSEPQEGCLFRLRVPTCGW